MDHGDGHFLAATEQTVKYHGLMHIVMHKIYVKTHPRGKSGNAVACASAAPMPLDCPICHAEINTWLIIAPRRGNEGGGCIAILVFERSSGETERRLPGVGKKLKAREELSKIIFEDDSKITNPVVAKSYEKQNYLVVFYQCHPTHMPLKVRS